MAISFSGPSKLISLSLGTTSLDLTDLWSRAVDWWLTSDNSKYIFPLTQVGGNDIDLSAGTTIPFYFFLQAGWKIRPQEANHTLNVGNGILLVQGGGDPFTNTVGSFIVRINYSQPVQAITVATGGGGGGGGATAADIWSYGDRQLTSMTGVIPTAAEIATQVRVELDTELTHIMTLQNGQGLDSTQATMLLELFRLTGLDPTRPLVVSNTNRSAGIGLAQQIVSDASSTTITRI